jgi:cytochrome c biogenesis factor
MELEGFATGVTIILLALSTVFVGGIFAMLGWSSVVLRWRKESRWSPAKELYIFTVALTPSIAILCRGLFPPSVLWAVEHERLDAGLGFAEVISSVLLSIMSVIFANRGFDPNIKSGAKTICALNIGAILLLVLQNLK